MIKIDWVDGSRDGQSWSRQTVMDSVIPYLYNFFCCSPHYPRRQVGRTVIGTMVRQASSFQNTSTLKSGYWDQLSELRDGTAARTVVDTTDRHKLRNLTTEYNSLYFVTDLQEGPSKIRRTVTSCVTPPWVGFPLKIKWVFWTINDYNYKISGVSLIIYLLGG